MENPGRVAAVEGERVDAGPVMVRLLVTSSSPVVSVIFVPGASAKSIVSPSLAAASASRTRVRTGVGADGDGAGRGRAGEREGEEYGEDARQAAHAVDRISRRGLRARPRTP